MLCSKLSCSCRLDNSCEPLSQLLSGDTETSSIMTVLILEMTKSLLDIFFLPNKSILTEFWDLFFCMLAYAYSFCSIFKFSPKSSLPIKRLVKDIYGEHPGTFSECPIPNILSCFQLLLLVWKICLANPQRACDPGASCLWHMPRTLTAALSCLPCIQISPLF